MLLEPWPNCLQNKIVIFLRQTKINMFSPGGRTAPLASSDQTAPPWSHGRPVVVWPGTSQWQTHSPLICPWLRWRLVQRLKEQHPWKTRNTRSWLITTFSFRWHVRSRATGALRLSNFCMNSVTAFRQWLVTGANPLFCFRGCLWRFRRATLHA